MYSDNSGFKHQLVLTLLICCLLLLIDGCSALQDLAQSVQKPQLSVTDVRVTDFNFSEIELTYDVTVDNPNALTVQMLAYDYDLKINERTFVNGQQNNRTRIEASGESTFQVPMTLNYKKVYSTIENLTNSEEAAYEFMSTVVFDLPGLGRTEVPVSKKGSIPLVRVPTVSINNLQVNNVSLSSANLTLNMELKNPNGFGLNVQSFDYALNINGSQWTEGSVFENISIPEKEVTQLKIPITLNIAEMGTSVYKLLTGSRNVEYKLTGNFIFDATHPLLGQTDFTVSREGRISLTN